MSNHDDWLHNMSPEWKELLFPIKEQQFPYVEKCGSCLGRGYKTFTWWLNTDNGHCPECKGRGYTIPQTWIEK